VLFRTRRMRRRNRFVIGGGIGAQLSENMKYERIAVFAYLF
jgi:hypothetical protein